MAQPLILPNQKAGSIPFYQGYWRVPTNDPASGYVPCWVGNVLVWVNPATQFTHNLLSATHPDTLADTVVRGDLLVGNSTPKWARLAKGTSGTFLKQGANDPAWTALASTDMSDFNEAAQDAVGNALVDGTTIDFTYSDAGNTITAEVKSASLDNTYIANRTRRIAITVFINVGGPSSVPSADAHGAFNAFSHWHLVDGATTELQTFGAVIVPSDFVSGGKIVTFWSSTVASNNMRWQQLVFSSAGSGTTETTLLNTTTSEACPGVANTRTSTTSTLTSQPSAGDVIYLSLARVGADAADTNTGTVCVWAVYFEYTADM